MPRRRRRRDGRSRLIDEFSKTPAYANHLDPALLGEFARLFVHVEHSKDMLPSMRVQLLLHGNLQLSGIIDHAHTKKGLLLKRIECTNVYRDTVIGSFIST